MNFKTLLKTMDQHIQRILNDEYLTIDHYKDAKGESYYEGKSKRYEPHTGKANSAFECLLKFSLLVDEQRRLAALFVEEPEKKKEVAIGFR
jgi:hypothetical protein